MKGSYVGIQESHLVLAYRPKRWDSAGCAWKPAARERLVRLAVWGCSGLIGKIKVGKSRGSVGFQRHSNAPKSACPRHHACGLLVKKQLAMQQHALTFCVLRKNTVQVTWLDKKVA